VPLRALSDPRLVARVRAGDDAAFEAIFDRHHAALLAFCRHMLGDHAEAEDAVQSTFVSALRAMRADAREIRLKPWLFAIARNRCLSVLRARRDAVSLEDAEPSVAGLGEEVERRADLRDLLGDLRRLPDDQREALVLAELGALAHDDVAEVLGVRREKVKALVFQARENLMGWREAREADCRSIREELATARGPALRRAPLRRHLDVCDDCRAFHAEVKRQRAAMAAILPVVPGAALKSAVLAATAAGGGALAAGEAGIAAGTIGAAVKGFAAKALMATAVAGSAGATGYVAVQEVERHDAAPPAKAAPRERPAKAAPTAVAPAATTAPALRRAVAAPAAAPGAKAKAKARPKHGKHGPAADAKRGKREHAAKRPHKPAAGAKPEHAGKGRRGAGPAADKARGPKAARPAGRAVRRRAHGAPEAMPVPARAVRRRAQGPDKAIGKAVGKARDQTDSAGTPPADRAPGKQKP
jgi:RNA polymerase sigma factor (sigma-70 family)